LLFELREAISSQDENCYAFNTLIIFTGCFSAQLGFQWYTAEEIIGLWKSNAYTDDQFMGTLRALEEERGLPTTAEFIDAFFEQYKGIEQYGYVLMRTSTKPYRWGVVEAVEYTNEQARTDAEDARRTDAELDRLFGEIDEGGGPRFDGSTLGLALLHRLRAAWVALHGPWR
jgi:hypothetical protein